MNKQKKERYLSANSFFKKTFGQKVYKLALDGGMTCPNRDGTCGSEGCIFCSSGGSGEFAEKYNGNISAQIEHAKGRVAKKAGKNPRYIAYFQSYTNTYAPTAYLRELFYGALLAKDVVALSVATRPDCLPEEILDLLGELNQQKPVFVELGLQTSNDETAKRIKRGYSREVYVRAVNDLRARGIHVITHVIFGLPGEERDQMLRTVDFAVKTGTDGVKLQLLQVLKDTELAAMWLSGEMQPLSREAYIELVCDALEILPPHIVVHRLTGDPPRKLLLAPAWATDKKGVLNSLAQRMRERNVMQGSKT